MQLLQINSRNIRSLLLFLYFVLFHRLNFNCGHYRNAETEKKGIPYLLLENAEFVLGEHSTNMLTLHSLFSYVHKPNLCWCSLSNFYSKSDHDLLFLDVCVCVLWKIWRHFSICSLIWLLLIWKLNSRKCWQQIV